MNKNQFIKMIKEEVESDGFRLNITPYKRVMNAGVKCSGFFDDIYDLEIRVAKKNKLWFPVLVHEYGHFTQWKSECKIWKDLGNGCTVFDDWVSGEIEMREKTVDRYFKTVRNMELDCEKRTVKLITKYNLDIDIPTYIQGANAYMYLYAYIKKYRTWPKKPGPTFIKKIWEKLPTVFLKTDEYNTMPEDYEALVSKLCFYKNNEGNHYWGNKNWVRAK